MKQWILRYDEPATQFIEALPLGNGKMGVMVYGGWKRENVLLNLDSLWSGPGDDRYKGQPSDWEHIRKLVFAHEYNEAENYIYNNILSKWVDSYLTAGNLNMELKTSEEAVCEQYERTLNINSGIYQNVFTIDGVTYVKEMFTSLKDALFVTRITTKSGERFSMDISLSSPIVCKEEEDSGNNEIVLAGRGPMYGGQNGIRFVEGKGIRFALGIRVECISGTITKEAGSLCVRDAQEILIYQSGNTDFDGNAPGCQSEGEEWKYQIYEALEAGAAKGYEKLREEHVAMHRSYFERVDFQLGEDEQDYFETLTTKERILRYQEDKSDRNLIILLFQFGRYLTIASSMPGSQCSNTQGIWNESLLPPWGSIYTVNINTNMNYWPTEICNLSEFHEPLFDLLERTAKNGKIIAEKVYGLEGWVCHHNIDVWGHCHIPGEEWHTMNGPHDTSLGITHCCMWTMGSGWLCRHLWEHYCYTLDKDFLEKRAFPLTEEAVRFYLGFLTPYGEYLVTNPSTSPENSFVYNGDQYGVTFAATCDISILKDLFANYLEMCRILNKDGLQQEVEDALSKLPPFQIGKHGELLEWFEDLEEADVHHRHNSHLYGLYPAELITREDDELSGACQRVLERRGDESSGWALVWRACLWARLGNGRRAMDLLNQMMRYTEETRITVEGGLYANLFSGHTPFQIDGNFGYTAAVAEMLLQNIGQKVVLLPAIPEEWKDGSVKGLRAKGGFEVDFAWKNHKITEFTVRALQPSEICIEYNQIQQKHVFEQDHLVWKVDFENETM